MINRLTQRVAFQEKSGNSICRFLVYGFAEDPTKSKDADYLNKGGD